MKKLLPAIALVFLLTMLLPNAALAAPPAAPPNAPPNGITLDQALFHCQTSVAPNYPWAKCVQDLRDLDVITPAEATQLLAAGLQVQPGPYGPGILRIPQGAPQLNTDGFMGPTTKYVQDLFGIMFDRIGTEAAAWKFNSKGVGFVTKPCLPGFICTFDVKDRGTKVYLGQGQIKTWHAATVRFIDVYPANDAVHNPCELTRKEIGFGRTDIDPFEVGLDNDSGFACTNLTPAAFMPATTASPTGLNSMQVGLLGGNSIYWTEIPGTSGKGWHYQGPEIQFNSPPSGHLDGDGWTLRPGSSNVGARGIVATWWTE